MRDGPEVDRGQGGRRHGRPAAFVRPAGRELPGVGPVRVTCAKGVVPYLEAELRALGFPVVGVHAAGVETAGTLADCMRLNLWVRTAQRVLLHLADLRAWTPEEFYAGLAGLPWERHVPEDGYLTVASSVDTPRIRDTRLANLKAKDAIVDRLRRITGRRPDSGSERRGTVVFIYWRDALCRVYLDTTGDTLSRRGYRRHAVAAPMQESLAAAVVAASGWDGAGPLVNPMCGSGTLAIEAALLSLGRAPGLLREGFGFMGLKGYDAGLWSAMRADAARAQARAPRATIVATDRDPEAVAMARGNAHAAGVAHAIEFAVCDFADTPVPAGAGVVLMNPEYGTRMGTEADLVPEYRRIGDFLKQRCQGYTGWVFTGNRSLADQVGLRARRRITFFNGEIECRLLRYDVYAGSIRRRAGAAGGACGVQTGLDRSVGT